MHAAIWNDPAALHTDRRRAWDAYVGATRNVVAAANAVDAHVVLISTDWVFDNDQDPARPGAGHPNRRRPTRSTTTGSSRRARSWSLTESAGRGTVARIAGVQGIHRARPHTPRAQDAGFGYLVASLVEALRAGERFAVWDGPGINLLATPTLATDAAELVWLALTRGVTGILHCCGGEHADRVRPGATRDRSVRARSGPARRGSAAGRRGRSGGCPARHAARRRRHLARARGRRCPIWTRCSDGCGRRWSHHGASHEPAHGRPGAGPLPLRPGGGAGRHAVSVLRRLLRDLRARQRRRARAGASPVPRPVPLSPRPQRAGDGPHRGGLRAAAKPARHVRVHDVGRAGRDEHGDRRGGRDDQPPAGAAAPRGHVRHTHAASRAPDARGPARRHRVGQRLLPPSVEVLRAGRAARAADPGRARGDACADRSGRDRGGHAGDARGRAGRGVRGPRRVPRAAHVDDLPSAARARGARPRRRTDSRCAPAADRRRRRRGLQRGDRRAARVRGRDRRSGGRDDGRPGRARLRPSAEPRGDRRHRDPRREPPGAGRGSRHRDRHQMERLHDRVEVRVPGSRRAIRQRQRRRVRRRQAQRAAGRGRRAGRARAAALGGSAGGASTRTGRDARALGGARVGRRAGAD